jgi:hypothetical protein
MSADPAPPEAERYPPYVAGAEQRRRWDLCVAIAQELYEGSEGAAAVIWQTTRVLYHGSLPTR